MTEYHQRVHRYFEEHPDHTAAKAAFHLCLPTNFVRMVLEMPIVRFLDEVVWAPLQPWPSDCRYEDVSPLALAREKQVETRRLVLTRRRGTKDVTAMILGGK